MPQHDACMCAGDVAVLACQVQAAGLDGWSLLEFYRLNIQILWTIGHGIADADAAISVHSAISVSQSSASIWVPRASVGLFAASRDTCVASWRGAFWIGCVAIWCAECSNPDAMPMDLSMEYVVRRLGIGIVGIRMLHPSQLGGAPYQCRGRALSGSPISAKEAIAKRFFGAHRQRRHGVESARRALRGPPIVCMLCPLHFVANTSTPDSGPRAARGHPPHVHLTCLESLRALGHL